MSFKIIILAFLISPSVYGFQCEWRSNDDRVKESKTIFLGKFLSGDGKTAKFSVEKLYVGKLAKEVIISFGKDEIAENYGEIKKFKPSIQYVITSPFESKRDTLFLDSCGLYGQVDGVGNFVKFLDEKFSKKFKSK